MVVTKQDALPDDRVFQALADATRRDILERTLQHGLSVSTLAGEYEMSFAAVQKHVAVLERAALITKERRGREQIVHGNAHTLRRVAKLLDAYESIWRGRSERIDALLNELAPDPGDPDPATIATETVHVAIEKANVTTNVTTDKHVTTDKKEAEA